MIDVLLEFGCYGPRAMPVRGELWRASSYDPVTEKRPGGSGDTPWEALAWWYVSVEETKRGIIVMARDSRTTPAEALAQLRAAPLTAPSVVSGEIVERNTSPVHQIDGGADSHLTDFYKPPSAATRRARTRKKKK